MKNILFATTALVATAGIASADVTFSGAGEAGVYRTEKVEAKASTLKAGTKLQDITSNIAVATATGVQTGLKIVAADSATAAVYATHIADQANGSGLEETLTAAKAALKAALATSASTAADIAQAEFAVELAQIKFDAVANAAVAAVATGDMTAYSGYQADVTLSAETDGGITFSMGFDLEAGLMADKDDDREMDAKTGNMANSTLTMVANGYTLVIGQDEIDDLYDDSQNGDISLAGDLGGMSFTVVHDLEDSVAAVAATQNTYTANIATSAVALEAINVAEITGFTAGAAAVAKDNNGSSVKLGYTTGAATLGLVATSANDDNDSANKISLGYTVSDALSFSFAHDSKGKADAIMSASATYAMDALTFTVSYADDKNHSGNTNKDGKASTNLKVGYAQGPISATFATDESSAWWVNANYDLGGGAKAFATVDHQEFAVAGLSFAF